MNSNNNQFPGLVDKLTILPCTQERVAGLNILELEQQPATNGKQIDRDDMYKLWRRDTGIGNVFEDARQKALSFGEPNNNFRRAMVGPAKERSFLRSGIFSISNSSSSQKRCKDIDTQDKWRMYAQYIKGTVKEDKKGNVTCVIVSHHNRMKKQGSTADKTDPLIPLTKIAPSAPDKTNCGVKCNAYANNFTIRIEIEKPNKDGVNEDGIKIEIVDPGFPDKGAFASTEACNNNTVEENEENEEDKNKGGGKKYLYCTKDSYNQIDDERLRAWLKDAFYRNSNKDKDFIEQKGKVVIYFIRHGNSIHNKPTNTKMVDSSLTYLGMIQAAQLGYNIANYKEEGQDLCQDFINPDPQPKVLLCGSFLSRTQLTGLIFLASLYRSCTQKNNNISNTNTIDNITDVLTNGDMYFGTNLQDAWNYLMKTAVENQKNNKHKIDEYIKYEPLQSIITTGDYTKANDIYKALENKYSNTDTNKGGRKTKKHKRKSRKMTRKVRVKRASKRVNKKASKKGHKKRSKRVRKM
jgi:hypothetical protein